MQPEEYEFHLEKMALTKYEQNQTVGWPNPVAYGFHCTQRKAHGNKRVEGPFDNGISDLFGL